MAYLDPMPLRIGPLLLWYLATYLLVLRLRALLRPGGVERLFTTYSDLHLTVLSLTSLLTFAAYSVGSYLLLHRLYGRYNRILIVVAFAGLTVGCMLLRAFIEEYILYHIFGGYNYDPAMSWAYYLLDNLYYAIIFLPVGIVYFFTQHGRYTLARQHATEVAYRETELKFLRSQVNPHFLFNTLNNLYSLVSSNDGRSLPVLEKLSGLLRYSLYNQQELVPLSRELTYVRTLIELESLRIHGLTPPDLRVTGDPERWQVPPLLLVPLIENAFKHGRLTVANEPLRVRLTITAHRLSFVVTNPLRGGSYQADRVGGIGLANVRKRLQLLYPGRHAFTVDRSATTFTVRLSLHRAAA